MIPVAILLILSLDQLSKFLITKNLSLGQSIPIIKGVFHLTLVHNRGAAFGLLKNQLPLFICVSVFAIALIFLNLKKPQAKYPHTFRKSRTCKGVGVYRIALALILSGAIGNLIDRLVFGYVIDFLDFRIWPVFNLADSAITAGAVLLGWSILREDNR